MLMWYDIVMKQMVNSPPFSYFLLESNKKSQLQKHIRSLPW